MKTKLWLLFAIVFSAGITSIVFSPREVSGDSQDSNIQTALAYLEQDIKNFEQIPGAKLSLDKFDYDLILTDTPPNPFLESEYVNPNLFKTYELNPTSPFYDPWIQLASATNGLMPYST